MLLNEYKVLLRSHIYFVCPSEFLLIISFEAKILSRDDAKGFTKKLYLLLRLAL